MKEFKTVIEELISIFRELTSIAQVKLQASKNNQVATIEACMTKEQSIIMRLKGAELKREKLQKEMGMENLSFQQMLDAMSPEEQQNMVPYFDLLSREIQGFQIVHDSVQKSIKLNLRQINNNLVKQGGQSTHGIDELNRSIKFTEKRV